jgi:hypothetical protein
MRGHPPTACGRCAVCPAQRPADRKARRRRCCSPATWSHVRAIRHSGAPRPLSLTSPSQPVVGAGRGHCWHRGSCRTGRPRCTGDHDRAHEQLDDRLRSWPVTNGDDQVTMTRGFHAFFRQYSNLRALLRRVDPDLQSPLPGVAPSSGGITDRSSPRIG